MTYQPIMQHEIEYNPRLEGKRIDAGYKRIIIVTDLKEENNLKKMIEKFSYTINGKIELVNLNTLFLYISNNNAIVLLFYILLLKSY